MAAISRSNNKTVPMEPPSKTSATTTCTEQTIYDVTAEARIATRGNPCMVLHHTHHMCPAAHRGRRYLRPHSPTTFGPDDARVAHHGHASYLYLNRKVLSENG